MLLGLMRKGYISFFFCVSVLTGTFSLPAFTGEEGLDVVKNAEFKTQQAVLISLVQNYFSHPPSRFFHSFLEQPPAYEDHLFPDGTWLFSRPILNRNKQNLYSLQESEAKAIALDFLSKIGFSKKDVLIKETLLHQVTNSKGVSTIEDVIIKVNSNRLEKDAWSPEISIKMMIGKEGWINHVVLDFNSMKPLR